VRPDRTAPEATLALLREAWITGSLEHPNVVPVHTLGRDANGEPLLVMKRIEGTSWNRLIGRHAVDSLGRDLEILVAVSQALAFAHSRGIIHRDVKPENVMLGPFGEVYVLDWGLAVSVDPDAKKSIPHVRDINVIAGTPPYMAPEMVAATSANIGRASDVFLLGATLHEVITGQRRNQGETVVEMLRSARGVKPFAYASQVPRELAEIANKATDRDPARRYKDATEFCETLQRFVRQRHALEMAAKAQDRLEQLVALCESADVDEVGRTEIAGLLAECRFGFQVAIRDAPTLDGPYEGLRRALTAACRYELRERRAAMARSLLLEIQMPDPDLVAAYEQLVAEKAAQAGELAQLKELKASLNLTTGARTRAVAAGILALVYGAGLVGVAVGVNSGWLRWDHGHNLVLAVLFVVFGVGTRWFGREVLQRTAVNLRISNAVIGLGVADVAYACTGALVGADPMHVVILHTQTIGLWFMTMAMTVDKRLLPSAVIFFAAAVLAAVWQPWAWYIMGLANFAGPVLAAWLWTSREVSPTT